MTGTDNLLSTAKSGRYGHQMSVSSLAFVHSTATVDDGATIGDNTKIWHYAHVMAGAVIGDGCVIGQGCYIGNVTIGNNVRIQNHVSVYDGVVLEDGAFCGPSCVFTNVLNPRSEVSRKDEYRETRVGRGASIGANATIVCGHALGAYSFVGAGAVVTSNVEPHRVVVGVPARPAGWICQCGELVGEDSSFPRACPRCGANQHCDNGVFRID